MSAQTGTVRPPLTRVPPAERGATRIADRVVAKIATQAAREALAPLPAGVGAPHATVVVRARAAGSARSTAAPVDTARVRVRLELPYPGDIGARCAAVRRRVTERVGTLTGMEVPEVAVDIERLHPAPLPGAVGSTR